MDVGEGNQMMLIYVCRNQMMLICVCLIYVWPCMCALYVRIQISGELESLRSQMINGTWCKRDGSKRPQDTAMGVPARSDLQHLLATSLHLLDLLPGTSLLPYALISLDTFRSLWTHLGLFGHI